MTKSLAMVSHTNYNLNANEGFLMFLTSKLITCFIDNFILKMTSQSIAYLLDEGERIYWIVDLDNEMHPIWVIWTSGLQESNGQTMGRAFSVMPQPTARTRATLVAGI